MTVYIYKILCVENNKVYIGQTKNPNRRWRQHKSDLKLNKHRNKNLQYQTHLCGSGTTGVACKQLKRNFIGIELNEDYYNISKDRIDKTVEIKKQTKLF